MLIYLKVDLSHPKANEALDLLEAEFFNWLPVNILSVNRKADNTVAWVKLSEPYEVPGAAKNAILETHADNLAALAEINSDPDWYAIEV